MLEFLKRLWAEAWPSNKVCHDLDVYLAAHEYVRTWTGARFELRRPPPPFYQEEPAPPRIVPEPGTVAIYDENTQKWSTVQHYDLDEDYLYRPAADYC